MLTEDGRDFELRIRMKRNVSELVGEYAMLKGEVRKLLRVEKIDFGQGEYTMLKREMNLIRQSTPFIDTFQASLYFNAQLSINYAHPSLALLVKARSV